MYQYAFAMTAMFSDVEYAQYINSKHLHRQHAILDGVYKITSHVGTTNKLMTTY